MHSLNEKSGSDVLRKEVPPDEYDRLYTAEEADGTTYQTYDQPYWDSHYYPLYTGILQEALRLGARRVLEIGCGSGSFAHLLFDRSTLAYHGFDFSRVAVEKARQRTGRPECFSLAAAGDDAMMGRPYDTIVCMEVLEHIERDLDVVRGWPPGVLCVCSVPNFDQPDHVRYFRCEDEIHERYGDMIELERVVRIPRALVRGRGWREYLRQLRWSRNDPKRFLAMLGYKTFENLAGWLMFSGRRRH
jgi:SAM-dependent methyltransferase